MCSGAVASSGAGAAARTVAYRSAVGASPLVDPSNSTPVRHPARREVATAAGSFPARPADLLPCRVLSAPASTAAGHLVFSAHAAWALLVSLTTSRKLSPASLSDSQ